MKNALDKIIEAFKTAGKIAVLPHISADGDALGASFALALALRSINKDVKIFLEEELPDIYAFLPGKSLAEVYTVFRGSFDMCIAIDVGDIERLGKRSAIFNDSRLTANIDHHCTNSEFAFYNYVDTGAPAAGEIIFRMLDSAGIEITGDIAVCLYVALITDTGGFRYGNTTPSAHRMAALLIEKGIDVAEISQKVFDTVSTGKVKLMGEAINSLELLEKGKIAFITVTDDMMAKAGAFEEDCDGIVNIGRNIKGVEVAAMLRERAGGEIKANLRSKSYVDVSAIAGMFGGGGHKRAAGFTAAGPLTKVKDMLQQDIKEVLF